MIIIPALIISFVPCIALYLWLRKLHGSDAVYRKLCSTAFVRGILSVFLIVLLSALSHILVGFLGIRDRYPLLYEAFYTFIVLALVEEIVKFRVSRKVLRQTDYPYSWVDVTAIMTITALGFGFIESIIYGIGASVPVVLIRGICVPHAAHGFIQGYFYGKGAQKRNPSQKWIGFVIAWFIHGLYDFSLSKEFAAINDNLVIVALILAILDIVLVIVLIRFIRKARKQERYTEPLPVREGE